MIEPEKPLKKKDQIMLDQELAFKLQAKEEEEERIARKKAQKKLSIEEKAKRFQELLEKRRKLFTAKRAEEKRNKPPTKAQQRKFQKLFDKEMKRVNIFVDMDVELVKGSEAIESEVDRAVPKLAAECDELEQEVAKKQKIDDDQEEAEMKWHMEIVVDKEGIAIDATKPLIIIIGEDLETLWKLVKAKHGNIRPEEEYERVLWGDLKVMFEPDIESKVWRSLQGHRVIVWKLFDSCGVHFVRFQNLHIYMLVEKTYPLTPATITYMINKKLQVDHWNEMFSTAGTKVNAAGIKVTTAKRLQLLKDYN
ncbi:hypothetical protein Tco_1343687 [Tanacetum coccineum]